MKGQEKKIGGREIYKGRIVDLYVDDVILPNGKETIREVIRHCEASAVLAFDSQGRVILERQYRYPYDEDIIEIPAGKMDKGESHLETARRELLEETGYEASKLVHLGDIYPSCAYTDEVIHIYMAEDLVKKEQHLDEGEVLTYEFVDFAELVSMIREGRIKDAKTLAAVSFYLSREM